MRINIHLSIDKNSETYVRRANQVALQRGFGDVDFSAGSSQIPHLTMLMGECSDEQLSIIKSLVASFAAKQTAITFRLKRPHLVLPQRKFAFIDPVDDREFFRLKRVLAESLGEHLTMEYHGGPENPPHITVGYFNAAPTNDPFADFPNALSEAKVEEIEISEAGLRGSCSGTLLKAKLGQS